MLLGAAISGHAQETAPFRLTGTEGHVSLRWLHDGLETLQGGLGSRQRQDDLREELFLMTHSYVYHPNFLKLDVGGGPILQQGRASSGAGELSSSDTLYNLTARASFLQEKPYRGSVFYEHLNPTLSVSPGSVLAQENERYGAEISSIVPISLNLDASRSYNRGSSVDRILDDRIDQAGLRASQSLGRRGHVEFRHRASEQESMSGSPALPLQRTSLERQSSQLDSRVRFGDGERYELFNLLGYDTQQFGLSQSQLPRRVDRRFLLDLRGTHSERLRSFASATRNSTDEGSLESRQTAGTAGFTYTPRESLSLRASGRAEDQRTTQFTVQSRSGDGAVQYRGALPLGTLTAGYAMHLERREQSATAAQATVTGERITLTGITPVPLAQLRVVAGSVTVSNTGRTQTYVEGLDYRLTVLGLATRVERLVGGAILDGQDVLVDYQYDTGGTFSVDQIDHALNVNWGLAGKLDVYVRYFESSPELTAGTPTSPLNEVRSTLAGSRADVPVDSGYGLVVGGLLEYEDRRETISPSRRRQAEAYVQTHEPFSGSGQLRFTARRVVQDYLLSTQDVDLTGYDVRLAARDVDGPEISVIASYERDTGASVERTRTLASARLLWRYRRASLRMEYTRLHESQGTFEQDRTVAQILLRRDF